MKLFLSFFLSTLLLSSATAISSELLNKMKIEAKKIASSMPSGYTHLVKDIVA